MDRPVTTLFMLMSVDGKISTGSTDELDFDRDLPRLPGVREACISTMKLNRRPIYGLLIPDGYRPRWE